MLFWNILVFILIEILPRCMPSTQIDNGFQSVHLDTANSAVTITSPGFDTGSYSINTEFTWEVVAPVSKKIHILFHVFDLEHQTNCLYDYVELADKQCNDSSTKQPKRFCGNQDGLEYKSTRDVLCIHFKSDVFITKRGFEAVAIITDDEDFISTTQASPSSSESSPSTPPSVTPSHNTTTKEPLPSSSLVSSTPSTSSASISSSTSPQQSSTTTPSVTLSTQPKPTSTAKSTLPSVKPSAKSTLSTSEALTGNTHKTDTHTPGNKESTTTQSTLRVALTSKITTAGVTRSTSGDIQKPIGKFTLTDGLLDTVDVETYKELLIETPKDDTGKYPLRVNSTIDLKNENARKLIITFELFKLEYHPFCSWDYLLIKKPYKKVCGYQLPDTIITDEEQFQMTFISDSVVPDDGFVMRVTIQQEEDSISTTKPPLSSSERAPSASPSVTPSVTTSGSTTATEQSQNPSLASSIPPKLPSSISTSTTPQQSKTTTHSVTQPTSIQPSSTTKSNLTSVKPSPKSTLSTSDPLTGIPHQTDAHTPGNNESTTTQSTLSAVLTSKITTVGVTQSTTGKIQKPIGEFTLTDGLLDTVDVETYNELLIETPKDDTGKYPTKVNSTIVLRNDYKRNLTIMFESFKLEYNIYCSWDYLLLKKPYHKLCGYQIPETMYTNVTRIQMTFISDSVIPDAGFLMRVIVQGGYSSVPSTTKQSTARPSNVPNDTPSPPPHSTAKPSTPGTDTPMSPGTNGVSLGASTSLDKQSSSTNPSITSSIVTSPPHETTSHTMPASLSTTAFKTQPTSAPSTSTQTSKSSQGSTTSSTIVPSTTPTHLTPTDTHPITVTGTASPTSSSMANNNNIQTETAPTPKEPEVVDICSVQTRVLKDTLYIESPGFSKGKKYPNNMMCNMTIHGSKDENIIMTIEQFVVERNSQCTWDYLRVTLGDTLYKLCGDKSLASTCNSAYFVEYGEAEQARTCLFNESHAFTVSASKLLKLQFVSDHIAPKSGFRLLLKINKPPGQSLSTTAGTFPPSTSAKPHRLSTAKVTTHGLSSSTFTGVQGQSSTTTSKQSDSLPTSAALLTTSQTPDPVIEKSTSATSTIKYASSKSTHKLPTESSAQPVSLSLPIPQTTTSTKIVSTTEPTYTKEIDICSGHLPEVIDEIDLLSPGFSDGQNYPLNLNCTQVFHGSENEKIILTLLSFDLEVSSTCDWDYVTIKFGDSIFKLCGNLGDPINSIYNNPCKSTYTYFVHDELKTARQWCLVDNNMSFTFTFKSTETLAIQFISDTIVARKGFRFSVQHVKTDVNTASPSPVSTMSPSMEKADTTTLPTSHTPSKHTETTTVHESTTLSTNVHVPTSTQVGSTSTAKLSSVKPTTQNVNTLTVGPTGKKVSTTPTLVSNEVPYQGQPGVSVTLPSPSPVSTTQKPVTDKHTSTTSTTSSKTPVSNTLTSVLTTPLSSKQHETVSTSSSENPSISSTQASFKTEFTQSTQNTRSSQPIQNTSTTPSVSTKTISTKSSTPVSPTTPAQSSLTPATPSLTSILASSTAPTASDGSSSESYNDLPAACTSGGHPYRLSDDIGIIESPKTENKSTYPPNILCRWKIEDLKNQFISLIFEWFDIEKTPDCRWDKLGIYEVQTGSTNTPVAVLCGDKLPKTITASTDVLIEFKSDTFGEKTGFRLKFLKTDISKKDQSFACLPGMTPCWDTKQCMPVEWLCDGEFDCPDHSDELICDVCQEDEFPCGNGTCIGQGQRCDGQQDCPYGLDEQDCVLIEDSGEVTVIAHGKPLPLCHSASVITHSNLVCAADLSRMATHVWGEPVGNKSPTELAILTPNESLTATFTPSTTCESASISHISCLNNDCGYKSSHKRRKRIIGGTASGQGDWPWVVALRAGQKMICGGTIIDKQWVLTAGHCVKDLKKNPQILSVVAGVHDINDVSAQILYVTEVVLHPDYHYIFNADIALLKMELPFTFNENVQQICMPWDGRQFALSSQCYIAGWGVSDMTEYYTTVAPRYLRHGRTKLVSTANCNASYTTYSSINTRIKDSMICAGYSSGFIDACKGDSGGGLMCQVADGRWAVAGVVSWGDMCGSTNKPGVYTRVTSFLGWINETLGHTGQNSVNCTFETSDWCGYQAMSDGRYIWTRKPAEKWIPGNMLYAIRADQHHLSKPSNATLITPHFIPGQASCLSFQLLFSGNSNITLSVYGIAEDSTHNSVETLLWRITSHYPAVETWQTSETNIPDDVSRMKFVSLHEHGGISGLGLDNVTLKPTPCIGSNFMKCNFNDETLCQYTNHGNTVYSKTWQIKHRGKSKGDFYLEAGGNYSTFGYKANSQFVSPLLTSSFTSLPRCLTFKFYRQYDTPNDLKVVTYSSIFQQLTNQRLYWSSEGAMIGQWHSAQVSIVKFSEYYDHIVFEVRRKSAGDIRFMIDDVEVYDGYCIEH